MGACCCSSRGSQLNPPPVPVYYYYPQALEEHGPLPFPHSATTILSTGFLVDTNLDTSSPDTYRAPPAPVPYDVVMGRPQSPLGTGGVRVNKVDGAIDTTTSDSPVEPVHENGFGRGSCQGLKESDCKSEEDSQISSPKKSEVEISKLSEPVAKEEEDVCPTCLEEYDKENPRIITKCEHHFHLSCILEWLERSDTCPVCDQEMIFDQKTFDM